MQSTYPAISNNATLAQVVSFLREIGRLRETEDLADFINLNNTFIRGRLVGRAAPSSNSDVSASDREGDTFFDGTYQYTLVDVSGTLKWDRRVLDVSW